MATLTKGKTFTNGELVTPQKIHELVDLGTVTNIVNADIAAGAGIADTKLATIATAGKVANTATTATSANTANAIVSRDAAGNFSAGTITAALAGNASTATKLATARTLSLTGDVTGSVSFDGSANASISAVIADDSHNHVIANVDGLQTALDGKLATTANAVSASKLATARTITLGGDLLGSVSFDGSANATITAAVLDDSHNHVISNVDGLQTALDGKQAAGSYAAASHTHDDRYYTETEVNTLLAGKQAAGSYAAASHTHDDRYYTEAEIDAKLSVLPVSGHTHAATDITSGTLSISRIPTGTTATTVCIGNDSRLSNARTPTAHTHAASDITSGTLAIARIPAGTTSTTVCIGNDSRLSDARTPTAHTHSAADITTGTLDNARTTATNLNTPSAIVARDGSGNFSAGTISGSVSIPKGGSLVFRDTLGNDFEILGNSIDDKLFIRQGGSNIVEIDSTTGVPIWRFTGPPGGTIGFGIGATPGSWSILEITSTTKGFIPPRMTETQRNSMTSSAALNLSAIIGMIIYNTTTNKLQVRTNTTWDDLH